MSRSTKKKRKKCDKECTWSSWAEGNDGYRFKICLKCREVFRESGD